MSSLQYRAGRVRPASSHAALASLLAAVATGALIGHARTPVAAPAAASAVLKQRLQRAPHNFEANLGQAPGESRYVARGAGYTLGVGPNAATLVLRPGKRGAPAAARAEVRMSVVGADSAAPSRPLEPRKGRVNYLLGSDPKQWRTNVPTWGRVAFAGVYPGIDLHYYGAGSMLEYDFVVAPHADPDSIRLKFEGVDGLDLNSQGDLVLHTSGGDVVQHRPVVYQETSAGRQDIPAGYRLEGSHEVAFTVAAYDHRRELVIDPTLSYSTYLGSTGLDSAFDIAVDAAGDAYVTGEADTGFPMLNGFNMTNAGFNDAFVTKLASDGTMIYSTFLGGKGFDTGYAITVDGSGSAYIAGDTTSDNYPTTAGVVMRTKPGAGIREAVVSKLSPAGDALAWSTYFGGRGEDYGLAIGIDGAGRVFLAGESSSTDLPTTAGAADTTSNGLVDLYVARLDSDGTALGFSTYVGGSRNDGAVSFFLTMDMALDTLGNPYVVATTESSDFPTANPLQGTLLGTRDAVVFKLSSTGSALLYSTFLGGTGGDSGDAIAVDGTGAAYVVGECGSSNFPVTFGAFDQTLGSLTDGYVSKLSPDGQTLVFSTLIGGNSFDGLEGVGVAPDGDIWVSGFSWSKDYPVIGAFQGTFGGFIDSVVTRFTSDLSRVRFSTYLGGPGVWEEVGRAVAIDGQGNVHVAGITPSLNWPTRAATQPVFGGGIYDAFVIRIGDPPIPPADPTNLRATATGISSIRVTWSDIADNEESYEVERRQGFAPFVNVGMLGANSGLFDDSGLTSNTIYTYRVRAANRFGISNYSNNGFARTFPDPPSDPKDLSVSTISQSDLLLFWTDTSDNETRFEVQQLISGTFTRVGLTAADETSFVRSGLTSDTEYTFRIIASNTDGPSGPSEEATGRTLPNRPEAPTRLAAAARSSTQVFIEWVDNSDNEAGYKLERKVPGGGFVQLASLGADIDEYLDASVQPASTYVYRVRAHNAGGDSAFSGEAQVTTPVNPPGAPANLRATAAGSRRIDLTWDDPEAETGIKLERKTGAGSFAQIAQLGANVIAYSDGAVSPESTYTYRIRALNAGGDSPYSAEAAATTSADPPAAPSNLTATAASQSSILLVWTDNSGNETGIVVEKKVGAVFVELATLAPNTVTYTETGLTPETNHTYRVFVVGAGGPSAPSNEATARTGAVPPSAPRELQASVVLANRVDLQWVDTSNNEGLFEVERRGVTGTFGRVGEVGQNVTTYTDNTVNANTTYVYRVRAVNAGGASEYSNLQIVRTPQAPPPAPAELSAVILGTSTVRLRWRDTGFTETSFRVERAEGEDAAPFQTLANLPANGVEFGDTTVVPDVRYRYRVVAVNAGGASAPSNVVEVRIAAGGRLRLSATRIGFGNVRVGGRAVRQLRLTNAGTGSLTVNIGALLAPFGGVPGSLTIPAGQQRIIDLEFAPTTTGLRTATLTIQSSDDRLVSVNITLTGKGVR